MPKNNPDAVRRQHFLEKVLGVLCADERTQQIDKMKTATTSDKNIVVWNTNDSSEFLPICGRCSLPTSTVSGNPISPPLQLPNMKNDERGCSNTPILEGQEQLNNSLLTEALIVTQTEP